MCGIIASTGGSVKSNLLGGLGVLQYRGYDSAGLATIDSGQLHVYKSIGAIEVLKEKLALVSDKNWHSGIAHTRWATHGVANETNSHPHISNDKTIALVHNGIIENYLELKNDLIKKDFMFYSDTDTEIISNLIQLYLSKYPALLDTGIEISKVLEGRYAIVWISSNHPGVLMGARSGSPLILGKGLDANYLASDPYAFPDDVHEICYLPENSICQVFSREANIFDLNGKALLVVYEKFHKKLAIQNKNYETFMEKEIRDQATSIPRFLKNAKNSAYLQLLTQRLQKGSKLDILACGSSYYSALFGKYLLKRTTLNVAVEIASEQRYFPSIINKKTTGLFISQSGETADTLACLSLYKTRSADVFSLTNNVYSSLARESRGVMDLFCEKEFAVASTKSVVNMFLFFYLLRNELNQENLKTDSFNISRVKKFIELQFEYFEKNVIEFENFNEFFFLGRGEYYPVALEAALKFKEICYLHAEAYPAGELKHGPLALVGSKTLCVFLAPDGEIRNKIEANIEEVKSRGAKVLIISKTNSPKADYFCQLPSEAGDLDTIFALISAQIMSFSVAKHLGNNIDQPRNLAKSVTVE